MSTQTASEPAFSVEFDLEDLQCCDSSLQVSEVWVVWEPVGQIERVDLALVRKFMNEAVKHSFLVFVLDQGQKLWGCEYRFMRVERQQQQDAADARLNIRFCR